MSNVSFRAYLNVLLFICTRTYTHTHTYIRDICDMQKSVMQMKWIRIDVDCWKSDFSIYAIFNSRYVCLWCKLWVHNVGFCTTILCLCNVVNNLYLWKKKFKSNRRVGMNVKSVKRELKWISVIFKNCFIYLFTLCHYKCAIKCYLLRVSMQWLFFFCRQSAFMMALLDFFVKTYFSF